MSAKIKFGPKWNEHTWEFEIYFDHDNFTLIIERPYASMTTELNRAEAEALRDALNKFLSVTPESSEQSGTLQPEPPTLTTHKLFVYGSLKKSRRLHHLLENSPLIGKAAAPGVALYNGPYYPKAFLKPDAESIGELYEVTPAILEKLDRIELGVGSMRGVRQVFIEDVGHYDAFIYLFPMEREHIQPEEIVVEWSP